jgi:hypothetical protein
MKNTNLAPFNNKKKATKLTTSKKIIKSEKNSINTACHYGQIACHYNGFFWIKLLIACVLMSVV